MSTTATATCHTQTNFIGKQTNNHFTSRLPLTYQMMPEEHELKRSLGLTPGETLGRFTVREIEVRHSESARASGGRRREARDGVVLAGCWLPVCTQSHTEAATHPMPHPHPGPFSFSHPLPGAARYRPVASPRLSAGAPRGQDPARALQLQGKLII